MTKRMPTSVAAPAIRCAIYTRKSTEEGLEQEFNSLDAQRESGENYIKSQASEGWECLPDRYDDGGFSGGNMERPALKRLLADIEAGKVDCVAVYKVDRLSRSLLDFAKMVEIFDKYQVSFVSVTQLINTSTSMGRLMLNVLLSFAQFERDNQASSDTNRPTTDYVYDDAGQLLEVIQKVADGSYRTTSYVYDMLGRLIRSVQPDPSDGDGIYDQNGDPGTPTAETPYMNYIYDAAGNLVSAKDANNLGTTYAYDALGRQISQTAANADKTWFSYDRVGNLLSLTDAEGNVTSWQYDELDRTVRERNTLGYSRQFEYDVVGNLTQRIDRNGRKIVYAYDGLNRLETESWFENEADQSPDHVIDFTWDMLGRLTGTSDTHHEYTYSYLRNESDIPTWQPIDVTGLSPTVDLLAAFDLAGNLTLTGAALDTSTFDFLNAYEYDHLNRLKMVKQTGPGANAVAEKRVDFTYDLAGQFDTITRYADVAGTADVAISQFTFDFAGRLDELTHETGDTAGMGDLLAGYDYTWNKRNQLTAMDFMPDGINSAYDYTDENVDYDYDNRHQLVEADYAGLDDETYTYDDNGNRTSGGHEAGANNQLLTDGTYNYEYDNEGNRTKRTEISSGDYTLYVWDHRNRLTYVIDFDDNGTPMDSGDDFTTSFVSNSYDAHNQWIKRYADTDGNPFTTGDVEQTVFIWQHGQIVLQFDKTGTGDLTTGDLSHRYLWGPAVDMLLADEQVDWTDMDADGEVLWALTDHLGTVRDVIDNSGTVVDHAQYDAFGNRLNAAAVDLLFGYTGKPFDEATGLQNNLHRWYDPAVGRWVSEDPIKDGTNWNAYVGNSATMYVDPDGLERTAEGIVKRGGGHHIVPWKEWWQRRLPMGVQNVFNQVVPHKSDHANNAAHRAYSARVGRMLEHWLGCFDDVSKITPEQAQQFFDAINNSQDPFLKGYLSRLLLDKKEIAKWFDNTGKKLLDDEAKLLAALDEVTNLTGRGKKLGRAASVVGSAVNKAGKVFKVIAIGTAIYYVNEGGVLYACEQTVKDTIFFDELAPHVKKVGEVVDGKFRNYQLGVINYRTRGMSDQDREMIYRGSSVLSGYKSNSRNWLGSGVDWFCSENVESS